MFYLTVLSECLFDLGILLHRSGMLQRSNKFAHCFPGLGYRAMHRGVIFRHLEVWRFNSALLRLLPLISGLSDETQRDQCADGNDQIDWPANTFHLISCSSSKPTAISRQSRND